MSVTPVDWTPMNEKINPRTRERMASPKFMLNWVMRVAQQMTVLRKSPMDHQEKGIRSAIGV